MLTIGIPVYNEENHIEEAILSAVRQTGAHIVIADNASSDRTEEICRKMKDKYGNIDYIRQPKNLGYTENFLTCLEQAKGKYFMWLGGHDVLHANYAIKLCTLLDDNPDAVLAYPEIIQYIDNDGQSLHQYHYSYYVNLLSNDPFIRAFTIILSLTDCTLIQGAFRTDVLKLCWERGERCFASDHVMLCMAAGMGKLITTRDTTYFRRVIRKPQSLEEHLQRNFSQKEAQAEAIPEKPHIDMQRLQLKVIESIPSDSSTKNFWINLSKDVLRERWGNF